jgi:hypothetical protein
VFDEFNPEETELKYLRWRNHIYKNIGFAEDKVLRYLWGLYDELIDQIKTNQKNNNNGKTTHNEN